MDVDLNGTQKIENMSNFKRFMVFRSPLRNLLSMISISSQQICEIKWQRDSSDPKTAKYNSSKIFWINSYEIADVSQSDMAIWLFQGL